MNSYYRKRRNEYSMLIFLTLMISDSFLPQELHSMNCSMMTLMYEFVIVDLCFCESTWIRSLEVICLSGSSSFSLPAKSADTYLIVGWSMKVLDSPR
jgi:hypothetical protein